VLGLGEFDAEFFRFSICRRKRLTRFLRWWVERVLIVKTWMPDPVNPFPYVSHTLPIQSCGLLVFSVFATPLFSSLPLKIDSTFGGPFLPISCFHCEGATCQSEVFSLSSTRAFFSITKVDSRLFSASPW